MVKKKTLEQPETTAQQLGSLISSARKIMRKDKGLSTDIDRLPLLTWLMFLKFLDDMESLEESKSVMRGEKYVSALSAPYRWRDWANKEDGITGPELLSFINQDETKLPDGKKGPGLLAYLRGLTGGNASEGRRRVIATVFKDITCRMMSGYLLRDVINKINSIHFLAREELFTLGHLYETMLREMRDAAGENGEFYTPRPVVKFMVEVTNPQLGEIVLDPACGTGGFLCDAYTHLEKQCKTVKDRKTLQATSLRGGEAKPLPYLLCQMNLLLHGLEAPDISSGNSLGKKLSEIGEEQRVDVILTNPPFGGEEEAGIKGNFPSDMQTAETALLFLQLIMRLLRRRGGNSRAAVVVPHGTLFGDGVCARIKEQLLKEFNLHTIIRLPNGVFAPYTPIPSNLLFFDRSKPTDTVWYYELALPEGRKSYSKTKPIQYTEFQPCLDWWNNREENAQAWQWNFKEDFDQAMSKATPHWKAAETARTEAARLNKEIRELDAALQQVSSNTAPQKTKLEKLKSQKDALRSNLVQSEQTAKEEQAAGDALYWPIYNLDRKNPNGQDAIEHRPPEELIESIIQKETRILQLMHEIKSALGDHA